MFAISIPTVFGQKTLVYCGDPKFGLVWFFECLKEISVQRVQILNGILNTEAQALENQPKWLPYVLYLPFEIWTIESRFWMSGLNI